LFLAARAAVLDAAPKANKLVYDAHNAVAVAYSFSEKLGDTFCHVAAYAEHVNLGFNRGAGLPDPEELLVGRGTQIRHIRIAATQDLARPGVAKLIRAAVAEGAKRTTRPSGAGRAVVKDTRYLRKRRPR
jgi:hypothetical protein